MDALPTVHEPTMNLGALTYLAIIAGTFTDNQNGAL